ncbi:1609_t:CDS:2 [Diversispora eburnea]|uniref:1609_t:CDS:1 n=1 Tax=Diversispora eburnea TaxID=1213867 RepID=A0A9N9C8B6_9GLOM|nr:1609_t:CDS:2 [Diversispora eburnea]
MIRSSLNLIVAWITIFSLTSSISGLGTFTHNETKPFENKPWMWQYGKYIDGTVVIRIFNKDPDANTSDTGLWTRPMLSLRIIHPNGTVSEIDKDLGIQEFNWYIFIAPDGSNQDPINIYALQKGYLLVRYFNASDTNNSTTYEEWGRIIDWNGNLYDEIYLGGVYLQDDIWYPSVAKIVPNVDPKKGFIRIAGRNMTYYEWQQFMIGDSFDLKKIQEGYVDLPQKDGTSAQLYPMATVDEGYSIIMGNSTDSTNSNNPFEIYAAVYYLKIGYNETQFSASKLLYQSSLPNITLSNLLCSISSSGVGQVCTLNIIQSNFINSTNSTNYTNYYVKLDFLISGSVTKITPLNNLPELPSNITLGWTMESIPFGGYLVYGTFQDEDGHTNAYGYYFNEIDYEEWDFPEPSMLNNVGTLIILPNNTLLISQLETLNTWSFLTTDMPNYSGNSDNGYSNLLIESTSPSINSSISNISNLTDMGNITITYYKPVELSDGNIWIYRIDDSKDKVNNITQNVTRQFVNSNDNEFCRISNNGLTVTIKVIISTFSYPNSQFYVEVDNNFVKSKEYGEPLMGIYDNIWKFNTSSREETFADTVSGVLRLTTDGTKHYENLNSTEKDQFFSDLRIELSKIIPVNLERLSLNKKTQVDISISPNRQLFISLVIQSQSSKEERSVQSILDDLNWMIKYKSITSISLFPTTNYLDETFGFETRQNLWVRYKIKLLGVILALGILGRNMAVFQIGLIIFDFVMDVLFVIKNENQKKTFIKNQIETFFENKNEPKTFLNWFTENGKVVSIFTMLSGADIEALSILHSNMAGFEIFNAPFSTEGKNKIFWGSCLNIFLEDMPQVIIQIYYQQSVVTYDIIPFLTLISSCLNLLINIIGRLYQAINIYRKNKDESLQT